jgi:5,10-methylenetetrahydromethanopterin reductase
MDSADEPLRRGIELTPEVPVDEVVDLAVRAESAGVDAAFVSGHYFNRAPLVALAQMAVATDDLRLGPGVANPYETHPVTLASEVATLDEASDGRAVFGIGAGDRSTLHNLGVDRENPLRRVLESFKVAQDLWAGERVDHDGTFTARDAGLNHGPYDIPVYVGAQGPHMLRMSAKHADGVLYNASHPADVAWAAERVEEGLDARPDDRGAFTFLVFASVSVDEDASAAREAARPPVAFITAGAAPPVLDRHGIEADAAAFVGEAVEAGDYGEAAARVTDRMLDAFSVAGTPADVAARFESFTEHADGVVAGSPLGPDRTSAIELLVEAFDRAGV